MDNDDNMGGDDDMYDDDDNVDDESGSGADDCRRNGPISLRFEPVK